MYGPGDVRVEEREDSKIVEPDRRDHPPERDLHLRQRPVAVPRRRAVDHQVMGHEYVGVVQEIGSEVRTITVGDFVVGSFWASDNTCEICQAGYQAYCVDRVLMGTIGTQSERARIPPRRRDPCRDPLSARARSHPVADGGLRRARHRLVRRRRRRGRAGQDRGGRR